MRDKSELMDQVIPESAWNKSRRSGGGSGGDCVEVAKIAGGRAVRDSQDPSKILYFSNSEWDAFTGGVQDGDDNLL